MKKAISLVMVLLLCAGMFAGCSKDKPEDQQAQEAQTEQTEQQVQQEEQTEAQPEEPKLLVLEGVNITAENVSPYEGLYLEAGDEEHVSGVYAMKFTNTGDRAIHSAQLFFSNGTNEMVFYLEMLPAGKSVTVAEINKLAATDAEIEYVDGTVNYLEAGLENANCVEVSSGDDGTILVSNTTDEALPLVRVFYRRTDGAGNLIAGPCYSFMIDGLEAGGSFVPDVAYWSDDCEVVTVLVVNE